MSQIETAASLVEEKRGSWKWFKTTEAAKVFDFLFGEEG